MLRIVVRHAYREHESDRHEQQRGHDRVDRRGTGDVQQTRRSTDPTIVATWKVDELSATALPKISRGTRFGVIACDVGIANARAAPNSTNTANTGHARSSPVQREGQQQHRADDFDDVARREDQPPVEAVRDLSGRQHQHDERQELRESDQTEIERIRS